MVRAYKKSGFASILALVLLALFAALGVAYASMTNANLLSASNQAHVQEARMQAESGVAFMLKYLDDIRLPGDTVQATFADNLAAALGAVLNGTGNLSGGSVCKTGEAVYVPPISRSRGSFRAWIRWADANHCHLEVKGTAGNVSRRLAIGLKLVPRQPRVFDYGLASRGQVSVQGSARIVGVNRPDEANVLSATKLSLEAIRVSGNATISGDLYAAGDHTTVSISGSPSVGGDLDAAAIVEHIHLGVEVPDFPQTDVAPLAALATNVFDRATDTAKPGLVLNNVRIPAGTNPTFSKDVQINGVMYVEAPNVVRFEGKTTLNGLVVAQDIDRPLDQCQIHFAGRVEAYGVESLPDSPEFAAVKAQKGTFILAPGFGVTFAGNFSAINGSIAADQLTFTGTAEGIVRGSVIGLEDVPTTVGGNVDIYVDRTNAEPNPAGFRKSVALVSDPSSYTELVGGG